MRIAGTVVLYNSTPACLPILETYWRQVEKLYVIDNSEQVDNGLKELLTQYSFITYIHNGTNLGIAHALNMAAGQAIKDGYDYLLTMDDDSSAPADMVQSMCQFLSGYTDRERVGIVSAVHTYETSPEKYRSVLFTMTSGNLLNLRIYQETGGFMEGLFIDHVDHEFGLRLNQKGYQVIELPALLLKHNLGEAKLIPLSGQKYVSHSPVRGYYFVRNGIIVARQYKHFRWIAYKLIIKEIIKAALFEREKKYRLKLIYSGIHDAFRNKIGKIGDM